MLSNHNECSKSEKYTPEYSWNQNGRYKAGVADAAGCDDVGSAIVRILFVP